MTAVGELPGLEHGAAPADDHDHTMPKLSGVTGAATVVDDKDKGSPDDWVPRREEMIRLTGLHPFNSEPPLSAMMDDGFFTSPGLHYIRNHGAVPQLDWSSHTISLQSADGTTVHELTMDELSSMPTRTIPVTMNCAGNRRKEQNVSKKSKGFSWGAAAVGTSYWTGVLLRDVLLRFGLITEDEYFNRHPDRLHVCFAGVDELPAGVYGTSIPMAMALDPARECMLAYKQNGALLTPDHGFPVRTMLPGMIGGRMIKWLGSIKVTKTDSTDFFHYYDNRVIPPQYDETNITDEVWHDPSYIINDRNLNSAITQPAHNEQLSMESGPTYTVKGYAYMGAGQRVSRVEVTMDDGNTWEVCTLYTEEKPTKWGKSWCWVFWSLDIETERLMMCESIAVRCWDESTNSQPGKLTWSILGMMNNCWFRVKMKPAESGTSVVRCLHPAVVDNDMKGWMVEENEAAEAAEATAAPHLKGGATLDDAPSYSLADIAKHNTAEDCWIILHGKVYDTTEFLQGHPGGANSIVSVAGADSSQVFDAIHSQKAQAMLAQYEIGTVEQPPEDEQEQEQEQELEATSLVVGADDGELTLGKVALHNMESDCWTVIQGHVYDITGFMDSHPGGKGLLKLYAGKVADEGFDPIHPFSILKDHADQGVVHLGELSESERLVAAVAAASAGELASVMTFPEVEECLNLYDLEEVACRKMKRSSFGYYATGATDGFTVDGNQEIYRRIRLCPRVMVNVSDTHSSTTMLGHTTSMPIFISAAAKGGLAHKDGEVALSRACGAHGVMQMVPHFSSRTLEDVSEARLPNQVQFVQIYVEKIRANTATLVKKMDALGFSGLFITVDSAGSGKRELDMRSTPGGSAPKTNDKNMQRWSDDMTWDDVAWFRSLTDMPIVLKGIQTAEDALLAYQHGVDGIVVSNHGGRQVDTARPALEVLVEVMDALRDINYDSERNFEVYVDGGIKRGSDVFKALAVGATAVGIGRAALYGLAAYGQAGVEHTLQILQNELYTTMQFMGTPTVGDIRGARLAGVKQATEATVWSTCRGSLPTLQFPE